MPCPWPLALASLWAGAGCSLIVTFDDPIADASPGADTAPTVDAGASDAGAFEPNDTVLQAAVITPGTYAGLAIMPAGDHDWYKFSLAGTSDVTIDVLFTNGAVDDLDAKLYDMTPTPIANSSGIVDNEHIIRSAAMMNAIGPGDFYIEIFGAMNNRQNSYTLVLTVQ